MRSPLEVSTMGVMFSVHGDSVRPIVPPRTFSVGFEEEIVPGVTFFTFTDPKIVVESLFPVLYLRVSFAYCGTKMVQNGKVKSKNFGFFAAF